MKKLLFIILLSFSSLSMAMNAELIPSTSTIKEGDIIEATLRIWPLEQPNETQLKALEGKVLFQSLYLFKINSILPSENNADVIEVKGTFVVRGEKLALSQSIEVNGEMVVAEWKGPSIKSLSKKSKEFFVLSQSTVQSYIWIIIAAIAVAVIISGFYFRKKITGLFRKKNKVEYTPAYFNQIFTSASSREDFERIYALKAFWLPLLKIQSPAFNDFFKVLNQHQYKKHWGADEVNEVKTSFETIRRSFAS